MRSNAMTIASYFMISLKCYAEDTLGSKELQLPAQACGIFLAEGHLRFILEPEVENKICILLPK
jgi:hypothetical protein